MKNIEILSILLEKKRSKIELRKHTDFISNHRHFIEIDRNKSFFFYS